MVPTIFPDGSEFHGEFSSISTHFEVLFGDNHDELCTHLVEEVLKRRGNKAYVKFLGFDEDENM